MKAQLFFVLVLLVLTQAQFWQTLQYKDRLVGSKGVLGYDYSTQASTIRWTLSATSPCDYFLVDERNFLLLRSDQPFSYFWSKTGGYRSAEGTYNQTDVISKKVIIVVKNLSSSTIFASFILEQLLPPATLGDLFTIMIVIFASFGVCVICYCIGLVSSIIRCFLCQPRHSTVYVTNGGYSTGFSTGGNEYSGSIGGGYSSGYGSGGSSGGNQYN